MKTPFAVAVVAAVLVPMLMLVFGLVRMLAFAPVLMLVFASVLLVELMSRLVLMKQIAIHVLLNMLRVVSAILAVLTLESLLVLELPVRQRNSDRWSDTQIRKMTHSHAHTHTD